MKITLAALVALTAGATAQYRYLGMNTDNTRMIATPAPFVYERAMQFHGGESFARSWETRVWQGGQRAPLALNWGGPGPAHYGAHEADFTPVYTRVGNVIVAVSPWVRIDGEGSLARMEAGRAQWLREQGYTGGVRVFRGTARPEEGQEGADAGSLEDRYDWETIKVPVKVRPRFEVQAPATGPVFVSRLDGARTVVTTLLPEGVAKAE